MRVGIDLSVTRVNQAGTAIYAASLASALSQLESELELQIFHVNQQRKMTRVKTAADRIGTLYRDLIWTHGILPWHVRRAGVDLLHMPANVIPVLQPCPTVVTILDTTILQMPRNFPFWHRHYSRLFVPRSAEHASAVITISHQSKKDICSLLGISDEKVWVSHLAASPRFRLVSDKEKRRVREQYGLRTFVLTVGTLEPRKNMVRLLRAFANLRKSGVSAQLVHVGPPGWLFDDIKTEIDRLRLNDSVLFLGRVPLDTLVALYNASSVFAYPSLYEGFGLPVLEAMACGCPVITSNCSSLPEVAGSAAILVDPHDESQIEDALRQMLADEVLLAEYRDRGLARAARFSWERCGRETAAVYRQVLAA